MTNSDQLEHLKSVEAELHEELSKFLKDVLEGRKVYNDASDDLFDSLNTVQNQITDCKALIEDENCQIINDWFNSC